MTKLIHIPEPPLLFRHGQATEDPRDGLTLFGPLDASKPYGIRAGVIGTQAGIDNFSRWVDNAGAQTGEVEAAQKGVDAKLAGATGSSARSLRGLP